MKLFTNGCSFTWGGGILEEEHQLFDTLNTNVDQQSVKFRESAVWPFKLHTLLNADAVINLGMGCGSNSRIVRTTLDYFVALQNNAQDVSEYVAVIQWSEPSRYEIYDTTAASWLLIKSDVVIPFVENDRYAELQYRLLEDPINHRSDMFMHMITLSSFFDKWNIKYMFTSLLPIETNSDYQYDYCVNNMTWFMGHPAYTICGMLPDQGFKYNSGHPNLDGHSRIASAMYDYMKSIGCA